MFRIISALCRRSLMIALLCLGLLASALPAAAAIVPQPAIDIPAGTVYSADTTWAGDQIYNIHGQISVAGGAKLTIQPGATLNFDANGSLVVNAGALIADGAAGRPITFTSRAPGVAQWAGLRFTENSLPAVFDATGQYVSGSLLRHVSMAWAEVAVGMLTQAPYVADSLITDNTIAVETGSSAARLDGNTFLHNQLAVQIGSGAQETFIHANTFDDNLRCISNAGMAVIAGNTITGTRWGSNSGAVIRNTNPNWIARIYDNRITGNTGGVALSDIQQIDFRHNLISDNSGFWCDGAGEGIVCFNLRSANIANPLRRISDNTMINNRSTGLRIGGAADQLTVTGNNLFGNGQWDIYLMTPGGITVSADANYWGGRTVGQTAPRIYDCHDIASGCGPAAQTGQVVSADVLPDPSQAAPAFIQTTQGLPSAGGLLPAAFDLTFSRPMQETPPPTLSFHIVARGQVSSIIGAAADNGSLTGMARDANGQMWFGFDCSGATGTCEPLRRFDGDQWTVYSLQNAGLPNGTVRSMYAQSNGDVWVSFAAGWLGRYRDNVWTFMQPNAANDAVNAAGLTTMGEDAQGRLWVSVFDEHDRSVITLLRFDGSGWQAIPLPALPPSPAARDISHIVTAVNGVWVKFGVNVLTYENGVWAAYQPAAGGPMAGHFADLWSDRRGRLWVSTDNNDDAGKSLYMFDGQAWTGWGAADWGHCASNDSALSAGGFTEDDRGGVWAGGVLPCGVYRYDGERWETHPEVPSTAASRPLRLGFDALNNLWVGDNGTSSLLVKWGGLDYTLSEGSWLSPARYRAPYSVNTFVPRGDYTLDVSVFDDTGLAADSKGVYTFTVDYAGAATDTIPPTTPCVSALGDGSLSNLAVLSWRSQDDQSGVVQYRYAVGAAPGSHDVLDWTDAPNTVTSANLTGLSLAAGQRYYVTVVARNSRGLWSARGVSLPVTVGQATQISTVYLPAIRR